VKQKLFVSRRCKKAIPRQLKIESAPHGNPALPAKYLQKRRDGMVQQTSLAATLAIVAAVGSYVLTFSGRPFLALLIALLSLPLGLAGLFMAASPRVKGGILSIAAMALGALAIVLSVLGMIGALVF
jgi:hypothetical protein